MKTMFERGFPRAHDVWRLFLKLMVHKNSATCPYLVLEVRREHLMQDTLAQLRSRKTHDLKKPLKIKYVESGEEGVIRKEPVRALMAPVYPSRLLFLPS